MDLQNENLEKIKSQRKYNKIGKRVIKTHQRRWGDKPGNVPNSQSIDGTPISNIYFNIYHKSDLL